MIDEGLEREQHGTIIVDAEVGLDVTNDGTLALESRAEEHALTHTKSRREQVRGEEMSDPKAQRAMSSAGA